jgi:hypothetical protein
MAAPAAAAAVSRCAALDALFAKAEKALARERLPEAEAAYRAALAGRRELLGETAEPTLAACASLAVLLHGQGRYGEAEALARGSLAALRAALGDTHDDTLATRAFIASHLLVPQGRADEAAADYEQVLALLRGAAEAPPAATAAAQLGLARALHAAGRLPEAAAAYAAVVGPAGADAATRAATLRGRAVLALQRGQLPRTEASVALLRAAVADDGGALAEALLGGAERAAPAPAGAEWPPLHAAAALGDGGALREVLDWQGAAHRVAAALQRADGEAQTALHAAARLGTPAAARCLLERGADSRAVAQQGYLAAHLAWRRGYAALAVALLPPAAPGDDPLFHALRCAMLLLLMQLRDHWCVVAAFWALMLPARWAESRWDAVFQAASLLQRGLRRAAVSANGLGLLRARTAGAALRGTAGVLNFLVRRPCPLLLTGAVCWVAASRGARRAARFAPASALAASLLLATPAWCPGALSRHQLAAAVASALSYVLPAAHRATLSAVAGVALPRLLCACLAVSAALMAAISAAAASWPAELADAGREAGQVLDTAARWALALLLRRAYLRVAGPQRRVIAWVLLASLLLDAVLLKAMHGLHIDPLRHQLRVLPMSLPRAAALAAHKAPTADDVRLPIERAGATAKKLAGVAERVLRAVRAHTPTEGRLNLTVSLLNVTAEEDITNAFATEYGHMFFYPALVAAADEDALACVVGHEATHAVFGHGSARAFVTAFAGDLLDGAACVATGYQCSLQGAGFFSDGFARQLVGWADTALSRDAEFEADLYGMYYAALAGFDAGACVRAHEPGGVLSDAGDPATPALRQVQLWTRSHPFGADRAAALRAWLPQAAPAAAARKLAPKTLPHAVSPATRAAPAPQLDASVGALCPLPVTSASAGAGGGLERRLRAVLSVHACGVALALELLARLPAGAPLGGPLAATPSVLAVSESAAAMRAALAVAARKLPFAALLAAPLLESALDALATAQGPLQVARALWPLPVFLYLFAYAPVAAAVRWAWAAMRRAARVLLRRAKARLVAHRRPAAPAAPGEGGRAKAD